MRTLVFGGSGFLGSHVADALTERGHEVTIFDLKASPWLRPGQRMVIGDILDPGAVEDAVAAADAVYNFAGLAEIDTAHDRPLETVRLNILGNCHLLEACVRQRVQRFVYASTVYVYSRHGTFYSASKQACEAYVETYRKVYGQPYTILRYGSLYGSRAGARNAINRLIREALLEGRMRYPGDGEELREYIHVEDAAAMSVDVLDPAYENQHVILTGVQAMRVKDLLLMIREILGGGVEVELQDADSAYRFTHYRVTPYAFTPQLGRKLVRQSYIDLGQGLLRCMEEVQSEMVARESAETPPAFAGRAVVQ
jgi:UDP-glucose 4-epimerase